METAKLEQLLALIADLVEINQTWGQKRDAIKQVALTNDRWDMNFDEFISWFPEE